MRISQQTIQHFAAKGLEYSNEFSDARWVYRYKVSKKADNLGKIKK